MLFFSQYIFENLQHCGKRCPGTDVTVNADLDEERRCGCRIQDFPEIDNNNNDENNNNNNI